MLEKVHAVQRMQDYIEAHLYDNITLADLSKVSLFSPWYAHRLFAEFTGLTPAEYIRKFRLSKSALQLRDEQVKIADAAFEAGFSSVDGYQRAFRREFGCNPYAYAKKPIPVYLFTPYSVKFRYTERRTAMNRTKNVFLQVMEKPARKVIVKRGTEAEDYMSYCEEVGCDVWGLLQSIQSLNGEPVSLWLPRQYRPAGTSEYVQGAEVAEDYSGVIPDGFDVIDLPAAKYLMFQGEPFQEEDFCEAIEEVWEAMKKYDPAVIGYSWDDSAPRIQLEPKGERGYIELRAVK